MHESHKRAVVQESKVRPTKAKQSKAAMIYGGKSGKNVNVFCVAKNIFSFPARERNQGLHTNVFLFHNFANRELPAARARLAHGGESHKL